MNESEELEALRRMAELEAKASGTPSSGIPGPRRTWAQTGMEALGNIPSSAKKFAGELYEAVTSPVQTARGLGMAAAGGIAKAEQAILPESVTKFFRSMGARPDLYDEAVKTAETVGGFYKDRYGSIDQLKNTIATDPVGAAADLSTLLAGGATAAGTVAPKTAAALGTASRIIDPLTLPTKAVGLGMRGVAAGAGNIIDAVRGEKPAMRAAEIVRQTATDEGRRPSNLAVLRRELQTAPLGASGRQAAAGVEAPQLQALGQMVEERMAPGVAGIRSQAEEAARRGTLQGVTPDQQAAVAARKAATDPLYAAARGQTVNITTGLQSTIDRVPRRVLAKAREIARMEGQPFVIQPSGIVTQTGAQAQVPRITGDTLHYIKIGMDAVLNEPPGVTALSKTERATLSGVKADFLREVEGLIPEYRQARQTFAQMSPPVNQAQVLTEMQSILNQPLGVGERPGAFMNALGRGEQAMLKRSTGTPRYTELADVLDPQQMQAVQSVAGELRQGANIADQAMRGRKALDEIINANKYNFKFPGFLNVKVTLANEALRILQGKMNPKVLAEIEKGFQSGKDLDALIGKVPAKDRIELLRALGEASTKLSSAKPTAAAQFQASQENSLAPQPLNALTAP
jgi:hypothetical protein